MGIVAERIKLEQEEGEGINGKLRGRTKRIVSLPYVICCMLNVVDHTVH